MGRISEIRRTPCRVRALFTFASSRPRFPNSEVSEVGTRYCTSAFALASEPSVKVNSYDVPGDTQFHENVQYFNQLHNAKMENEEYLEHFPNIKFWKTDLLTDDEARKHLVSSKVVLLDTEHQPETHPFEYAFIEKVASEGFSGLMVMDDIGLNDEMRRLWESCVSGS